MRRNALLAALLAAAAFLPGRAAAEVSTTLSIGIKADRSEFVRGEDVTLTGVVRNTGSVAFIVDDYGPYLANRIRLYLRDAATGRLIDPRPGAPASAVPSLTVKPGEEKTFAIRVGTCYDLPRHARVQATAVIERGESETAASRAAAFTVVEGMEFSSVVRTLPGDERRAFRFTLLYWARDQVEDIFLRVTDPAIDLSVIAAVLSSNGDMPIEGDVCMAGEVGLSGEIRPVARIEQRIAEAQKLGFKRIIIPAHNMKGLSPKQYKIELVPVRRVVEAVRELFG